MTYSNWLKLETVLFKDLDSRGLYTICLEYSTILTGKLEDTILYPSMDPVSLQYDR